MGTRGSSALLVGIPFHSRQIVEYYAAEAYPQEVMGFITFPGMLPVVHTKYLARSSHQVVTSEEVDHLAGDFFGERHFGFHSHPILKNEVFSVQISDSDVENMIDDGDFEWIVAVTRGKSRLVFKHGLYRLENGRPRRAKIIWEGGRRGSR